MSKQLPWYKAYPRVARKSMPAFLALMLFLAVSVTSPVAQDLSDEALSSQLEAVILEQTVSPEGVNTIVEVPVQQDTYITSNKPNRNYGQDAELRLGYNRDGSDDGALRPFMQFDVLRYIPSKAVIKNATLHIYMRGSTPAYDSSMTAMGRHLLTPWDENQVTWHSHQPDWGGVTGSTEVSGQPGWQTSDVTELAKEWHSTAHPNYGVIILGDERVQERQRIFDSLNANNGRYPRLVIDYTLSGDITPPVATVHPLPEWSQDTFTVSWSGYDEGGSGIAYFDVQYRTAGSAWVDWRMHTTAQSTQFVGGDDGRLYRFRCRAVDHAGNIQQWGEAQARTRVDATPPNVSVDELPGYTHTPAFEVSWSGSDNENGSGIAAYDIQYRKDESAWKDWLINTTLTTALFTGAHDNGIYGFRARGIDVAGNVQPYSHVAQAATHVELGPHSHIVPFKPNITREDSFPVAWTGTSAPGTSIEYFDVRYQFKGGPWIEWLSQTKLTGATFNKLNPEDGVYGFEVRAKDSAGGLEPFEGTSEAGMIVDRNPPFMQARLYLPLVDGWIIDPR